MADSAPAFAIADLFEIVADSVPERLALVGGGRRLRYRELDDRTTRLAHVIADAGVGAGDFVACYLTNRTEHVETMLACYKLRAVPVNVNYRYVDDELAYLFTDADAAAVVHDGEFAERVRAVRARVPSIRAVIDVDDRFDDLVTTGSAARDLGPRSPDDLYVLYTGGTTGRPKGVVWRQEDIVFAVLGGGNPGGPAVSRPEEVALTVRTNTALRLGPMLPPGEPPPDQFVQLALGPLMHASGQWSALGTLTAGGTVVLYTERRVDMAHVLDLVQREGVVALNLVGDASARPLLDALDANPGRWDTSSLRLLGSGGTILTGEVKDRLLRAIPTVIAITEAVGSSEAPAQAVAVVARSGTPSRTLAFAPKADTIVVDDDLVPIAAGTGAVGRLATRGHIPLRYHKDPERSAATFVEIDGVRHSLPGDMATVDADGTVRLLGRGALCINTGGEKVYPEEVEGVLKGHPGVVDAVVVGVPHERWGEAVAAIVAPVDPTSPPSAEALVAHCRDHLAGYKVPRSMSFTDAVPRSAAGKADYAWARAIAAGLER